MAKAKLNPNANPAITEDVIDAEAHGAFSEAAQTEGEGMGEGVAPVATQATTQTATPATVLTQVDHFLDGMVMVSGALFKYEPKDGSEYTEGSPSMTGSVQIGESRRVGVAAWKRVADETGVIYAEVCVGDRGKSKYYGRMFHNNDRDGNPSYGGYLTLLPVERANQYTPEEWDAAPKMNIFGIARRNRADGKVRISLSFTDGLVSRDDVPF